MRMHGLKRELMEHITTMDKYKEFCRLRDYRKPGIEVPHYTEAEAFALAAQNKASNAAPVQHKKSQPTKGKNQ